jgi:hypothetical protein
VPFLLPALPAIIGAGGAIGGALLSGPSKQQKQTLTGQQQLDQQLTENAKQGSQLATQFSSMATPALNNAMNYWSTLLNGDRTAMSSVLGPEVSQIGQGIANATNTTSQFAPRGGARTTALAGLPFQQASTVGNLYSTLRPAAASAVGEVGLSTAGLASSFLGNSTSAAGTGANSYLGLVSALEGLRQNQMNTGANIGSSLYTWAKGVDWGKIFGGAGKGDTGGPM